MSVTNTVIGVDPGIVHTGVVMFAFDRDDLKLKVDHRVVDGLSVVDTLGAIMSMTEGKDIRLCDTFIEYYRPRSNYSVDQRMVQANALFQIELHGTLVKNTGVKKIVSKQLMELCHVWDFSTRTHHQDLRSAARIALLGMMLDPTLNELLYTYVTDTLDGRPWDVSV